MVAASGRGFHEADVSSTYAPLRASPVEGEFINSAAQTPHQRKSDVVSTSLDVEICMDGNFS